MKVYGCTGGFSFRSAKGGSAAKLESGHKNRKIHLVFILENPP